MLWQFLPGYGHRMAREWQRSLPSMESCFVCYNRYQDLVVETPSLFVLIHRFLLFLYFVWLPSDLFGFEVNNSKWNQGLTEGLRMTVILFHQSECCHFAQEPMQGCPSRFSAIGEPQLAIVHIVHLQSQFWYSL